MGKKFGATALNEYLIFNHHSLPYDSIDKAKDSILEFLKVCLKLKKYGYQTILFDEILGKKWFRIELAPNYFWQDWYNENKNEVSSKTQIQLFLSLRTKSPLFSADDIASDLQLFEVKLPNCSDELSVLRAAIWHECPIVSYPTKEPWNKNFVLVNVVELDESGENRYSKEIVNYFDSNEIDENSLRNSQKESILSGQELLEQKNELFSNLDFCGDSQSQLRNFDLGKAVLEQVKDRLHKLDEFCNKWNKGHFQDFYKGLQDSGLNVSRESESVRDNPEMRSEREFYLPNGKKEFFENHMKLGRSIRIHFYQNADDKKVYIGFIGKHLQTKKYKS
jgi:hypothetical protein